MKRRSFLQMMGMLGGAVLAESVSRVYSFPSQIVIPNKKVICPSMEEVVGLKLHGIPIFSDIHISDSRWYFPSRNFIPRLT